MPLVALDSSDHRQSQGDRAGASVRHRADVAGVPGPLAVDMAISG
jgi:hypothetical protein